jgi:methionyl-tRNA formyltransferase
MLLENKPEYVGITVHHIDAGIDSGDIIISCRPALKADDNYEIIDAKCFHIGIEAMVHACKQLFSSTGIRVKQWQQGKLFLNRTGYFYQPAHRLEVNRLIEKGLLADYLQSKPHADNRVRTVGEFYYRHD